MTNETNISYWRFPPWGDVPSRDKKWVTAEPTGEYREVYTATGRPIKEKLYAVCTSCEGIRSGPERTLSEIQSDIDQYTRSNGGPSKAKPWFTNVPKSEWRNYKAQKEATKNIALQYVAEQQQQQLSEESSKSEKKTGKMELDLDSLSESSGVSSSDEDMREAYRKYKLKKKQKRIENQRQAIQSAATKKRKIDSQNEDFEEERARQEYLDSGLNPARKSGDPALLVASSP